MGSVGSGVAVSGNVVLVTVALGLSGEGSIFESTAGLGDCWQATMRSAKTKINPNRELITLFVKVGTQSPNAK